MFDLQDIYFFYFIATIIKNMWDYFISSWKPGKCFPFHLLIWILSLLLRLWGTRENFRQEGLGARKLKLFNGGNSPRARRSWSGNLLSGMEFYQLYTLKSRYNVHVGGFSIVQIQILLTWKLEAQIVNAGGEGLCAWPLIFFLARLN